MLVVIIIIYYIYNQYYVSRCKYTVLYKAMYGNVMGNFILEYRVDTFFFFFI